MKEYHFQENDQDFGLTVRLDDINEKVKQLKKNEVDDELGDANDFLKAFQSEKFDTPLPEPAEEEEIEEETVQPATVQPARRRVERKQPEPVEDEEEWEEYDEE